MPTTLPPRAAVDPATTWDLTAIYKTKTAFEEDVKRLKELAQDFTKMYTDRLTEAPVIIDALADYADMVAIMDKLGHYAFLPTSADTGDADAASFANRITVMLSQVQGELSFFDAQLQQQPTAVLDAVAQSSVDNAAYIRHVKIDQLAALNPAVERALVELGQALDAPDAIRSQSVFGDMDFGTFEVDGTTYPLSFVLYEEEYQKHPNTAVRRAAYQQFCKTLAKYQNGMAAGYYNQVAKEKTIATMRGFDSVFDYLLAGQEVTRDMFDRQIDMIMEELAPVMRRYVTHIKDLWGLDHIGYTDLQIDLDPDFAPKVTRDQAPQYIEDAIAPLGPDYQALIGRAFAERWIDYPANAGKESGAFATAPYGVHPYVLMSWSDTLPAIYTLVHELGHCGQMSLASAAHNALAFDPSMYIVEGPSTFHELLLTHSLVQKATDPRMKRFALSRLLSDTYFHNCVTHLLEAAFQREVYTLIDNGESFDAAKLNELKKGVLHRFWGDAVDLNDGMPELTWMRQSHYYMGLYSYTYSASMVVSTGAYLRYQNGDASALADWKKFLALGDSLSPIEEAKVAGVDITTPEALHRMIAFLADTEQQIEALSAQIK